MIWWQWRPYPAPCLCYWWLIPLRSSFVSSFLYLYMTWWSVPISSYTIYIFIHVVFLLFILVAPLPIHVIFILNSVPLFVQLDVGSFFLVDSLVSYLYSSMSLFHLSIFPWSSFYPHLILLLIDFPPGYCVPVSLDYLRFPPTVIHLFVSFLFFITIYPTFTMWLLLLFLTLVDIFSVIFIHYSSFHLFYPTHFPFFLFFIFPQSFVHDMCLSISTHFSTIFPIFFPTCIFLLLGKSPIKSIPTLNVAQVGLVLFWVAMSTCKPTSDANEKIGSF